MPAVSEEVVAHTVEVRLRGPLRQWPQMIAGSRAA